jgi:hypothetical protein
MKSKATHRGRCQVCNRIQKLPNGLLAQHGYAVLDGYFEGVCYGSKHLPLEQDKATVVRSISVTQERIQEFEHAIRLWSVPAVEPKAWFHEYVPAKNRYIPPGYRWRIVDLHREVKSFPDGFTYNEDTFTGHDGKEEPLRRYSISGATLLVIADQLNLKYVEYLRKGIKDMQSYIHSQEHRIKVWHQQPLLPLED